MKSSLVIVLAFVLWTAPTPQSSRQPSNVIAKKENGPSAKKTANPQNKQQAAEDETLKAISAAIAKDQEDRANNQKNEEADEKETIKAEWWLVYVGVAQAIALVLTFICYLVSGAGNKNRHRGH